MQGNQDISIREAQPSDVRLYYTWANDPIVRKMAFHGEQIVWEIHCKWFSDKMKSDKAHLTIGYLDRVPVGQVRFDEITFGIYEIDISIDKAFRGKGIGCGMLSSAIDYVRNKYHINHFVAEVKNENIPSQKMFMAVGFMLQKVENQVNHYELLFEQ